MSVSTFPFAHPGAEPTFEPVDGDKVRVRWTTFTRPEDASLCEGTWGVDELAAAQRGEADLDESVVRRTLLAEVIAEAEAQLERIRARRDELVNQYPALKARRR